MTERVLVVAIFAEQQDSGKISTVSKGTERGIADAQIIMVLSTESKVGDFSSSSVSQSVSRDFLFYILGKGINHVFWTGKYT